MGNVLEGTSSAPTNCSPAGGACVRTELQWAADPAAGNSFALQGAASRGFDAAACTSYAASLAHVVRKRAVRKGWRSPQAEWRESRHRCRPPRSGSWQGRYVAPAEPG